MLPRTFRLFVSSTFSDMKAEREILQGEVFPRLARFCKEHGFAFQAIDLRWGVSAEAQLDQKTLDICLNEVRESRSHPRPNFLILLGDRYGWVPLPDRIPQDEFEGLINHLRRQNKIPDLNLLQQWYRLDENCCPASYLLCARHGVGSQKFVSYNAWERVEDQLREILQQAANTLELSNTEHYFSSATEREILEAVPGIGEPEKSGLDECSVADIHAVFRKIDSKSPGLAKVESQFIEVSRKKKLSALRNAIRVSLPEKQQVTLDAWIDSSGSLSDEYCTQFREEVFCRLRDSIKNRIEELKQRFETAFEVEEEQHRAFCRSYSRIFFGRNELLERCIEYTKTNQGEPFVIAGEGGSGKSSFMAKLSTTLEYIQSAAVVTRFIGASAESITKRGLLLSLCERLSNVLHPTKKSSFQRLNTLEITEEFKKLLQSLSNERRGVIILIDALDQLLGEDGLEWLPKILPPSVRIIVSTTPGHYLDILANRYKKPAVDMPGLESNEVKNLLDRWLSGDQIIGEPRSLSPEQINYVQEKIASNTSPRTCG